MSKYYAESNDESTQALFAKRIIYRTEPKLQRRPVVNFTQGGEKFLYGRVTPGMLPMQLRSNNSIANIESQYCEDARKPQQAVHFVVDAFNYLAAFFANKVQSQAISTTDPYLSYLRAYKSYEDPNVLYTNYQKTFEKAVIKLFKKDTTPVTDFKQFMDRLLQMLEQGVLSFPFTKPAYIKSKICPMRCSGLVIEIADLDYGDDLAKKRFIESPNWELFVEACNQYGFMIDLNVPWRLVADIDSIGMQAFSGLRRFSTTGAILGLYKNIHRDYMPLFVESVYEIYKKIKRPTYTVRSCNDGAPNMEVTYPAEYTLMGLMKEFKLEFFLNYYFQIRFAEEESQFTAAQKERIISETLDLYRHGPPEKAINIFEQILNKTFDYSGSLSYIIERKKQVEDDDLSAYR